MKCRDTEKKLSPYLEGIVSPGEQELVENHLSSCPLCRTAFEELKRTNALVKGLEQVETPPWFTQRIMSRVRAEQESKKSIIQRLFYPLHIKVPIEAFATVLIAVAAVYLFKASEPEMNRLHIPTVAEQAVSKDEASKQSTETKGDTTIAGGKVALEGVPKPQKQKGVTRDKDQGEKEAKEELKQRGAPPSTAKTPLPSVLARKKEVPKEPSRPSEPSSQQPQAYRQPAAPAEADQEIDPAAKAFGRGEKVDRRVFSAGPQITALAARKPGALDVTLYTRDAKAARSDVENLLGQLGAQNIKKESLQAAEIITAELQAEKMQELFEKLKVFGEVKEKELFPELSKGTIGMVRIEMTSPP